MTWRALLDGDVRARALARVEAIADELDRRTIDDPSLASGLAGVALVHGYRARAGRGDGADRAFAALERALAGIAAVRTPGLFAGIAGIAFAIEDLGDLAGDADDVLAQLDGLVARGLAADPRLAWDVVEGVIGLGVYGLARGQSSLIDAAVAAVTAIAERGEGGATWWCYGPVHDDRYHNLGLAHGVACAIAFLAEAQAAGHVRDPALVGDAVRWLRARERDGASPRYGMHEPPAVDPPGIYDGWCYGDVSTALVLVRAGELLGEPAWRDAGLTLARHAARRTDDELARLAIDASLCHGAIGHAHLFGRLAQHTGDDELSAAARRWCRRVLADGAVAMDAAPGLQNGLAGVALGLLAASTDVEPTWDRAFLLSPLARRGGSDALR